MNRIISVAISILITSGVLFPFSVNGIPIFNTKMFMAVLGIIVYLFSVSRERKAAIPKKFTNLTIYSAIFSIICLFSVIYNDTPDYAYATYIVSMWVWLGAAYFACHCIKRLCGELSLKTVTFILMYVCVFQCIMALAIDNIGFVKNIVDSFVDQGQEFFTRANRLYGIGASLDVAGTRFAAVLLLIGNILSTNTHSLKKWDVPICLASFAFIFIVGSMISRTTMVGAVLGIALMVFQLYKKDQAAGYNKTFWKWFIRIIVLAIAISVYYYYHNASIMKLLRFGFEGFFSLWEKGTWDVSSNEVLKSMVVYPETLKTWLIGDGYFGSASKDQFYTGDAIGYFYMNTDIGYLRLIFYCGTIGLASFAALFLRSAYYCSKDFPKSKLVFWAIAMLNFIIWFKVSTDIFVIFAILLMIKTVNDDADHPDDIPQEDEEELNDVIIN